MTSIKKIFDQDGVVTPIDALNADEVTALRNAFDRLEAEKGKAFAQAGILGKEREYPFIWEAATHPRILDAVEQVLGPDLLLLGTHAFCKYPVEEVGEAAFVAWHQDVTYWGLEPPLAITGWLAIDDVDEENGAMVVIAGSHRQGIHEHGKSETEGNLLSVNQAIDESKLDLERSVTVALTAGQISLHDGLAVHGSHPNRSARRRCGLVCRYTTPDVRIVREENRKFEWQAVRVRGDVRETGITLLESPVF